MGQSEHFISLYAQQVVALTVAASVADRYLNILALRGRIAIANENTGKEQQHLVREVEAAREAFKISQLQYRQGVADLLTILQAQQTLFSAEDQLVQAMQANRQASVQLFEALGGGWTENPDEQTQFPVQNYTRQTAEGH
ncbi:MAG: TolC family protein [Alphaproteobacteria bacterium]|nr:TolC family protein [Alphaproteobacteria bacterium]MDE2493573.1 TolC family protein [Alphaproteobacteria bacterium]